MVNFKRKLVSVLLPVYNGERYLEQSIRSVLEQTYENLELIIVNDASTDNSLYIAQNLAKDDSRIRIITNPENLKLPKSLNKGFENANGLYIISYMFEVVKDVVEILDDQTSNSISSINEQSEIEPVLNYNRMLIDNRKRRQEINASDINDIMAIFNSVELENENNQNIIILI